MKIFKWFLALFALYAEVTLGCQIYPLELLRRASLRGPLSVLTTAGANQFAGRTALASGTASVTVSTAIVNSDSLIFSTFAVSSTSVASGGVPVSIVVNSIVSGVSFAFANQDGIGRAPGGTILWEIRRTS